MGGGRAEGALCLNCPGFLTSLVVIFSKASPSSPCSLWDNTGLSPCLAGYRGGSTGEQRKLFMPHSPNSVLTLFILLWLQMLILEPTRCISTSGPLLLLCPSLISQNFTPLSGRPSLPTQTNRAATSPGVPPSSSALFCSRVPMAAPDTQHVFYLLCLPCVYSST